MAFAYPLEKRTWGYSYGLQEEAALAGLKALVAKIKNDFANAPNGPAKDLYNVLFPDPSDPSKDLLKILPRYTSTQANVAGYRTFEKLFTTTNGRNALKAGGWTKVFEHDDIKRTVTVGKYSNPVRATGLYNGVGVDKEGDNAYRIGPYEVLDNVEGYPGALTKIANILTTKTGGLSVVERIDNILTSSLSTQVPVIALAAALGDDTTGIIGNLVSAAEARYEEVPHDTDTVDLDNIKGSPNNAIKNALTDDVEAGHAIMYAAVRKLGKTIRDTKPSLPNTPYTKNGKCGGAIGKRATGSGCLPEIKIINADSKGAETMVDNMLGREEINALAGIGAALGDTENILNGYEWEGVPTDWDDGTELDHNMIFKGSNDIDDAFDKLEDFINEKLDGDSANVDRDTLTRALTKLRRTVRIRVANLKALDGDIKMDKQITAESRKNAVDRLFNKYKSTFGSSVERDNPDNKNVEGMEGVDLSELGEVASDDFDDYRSDETITSVNEADALDLIHEIMPEEFGSLEDAPSVEQGGEALIDMGHMFPGSTSYDDAWVKLAGKLAARLAPNNKFTRWQYRRLRTGLNKMAKAIDKRAQALDKKVEAGIDLSKIEVAAYEAMHESYTNFYKQIELIKPDELDPTDKPDPDFAPDPGFIRDIGAKKVYKPTTSSSKYVPGIKAFKDSLRRFKKGYVSSTRGTQRSAV